MKIIDAVWELRNMGVVTKEIHVEDTDTNESVKTVLKELNCAYSVVKTPVARIGLYQILTELGYVFAEVSIGIVQNLNEINYSSEVIRRMCSCLDFIKTRDLTRIDENIKKGMFTSDRVALDPYFSMEQAANRYVGWMGDELNRGSQFFEYLYKDVPIGFLCLKEKARNEYYSVLGGLYPSGNIAPFGMALLYKQLEIAKSLGGRVFTTNISSNNITAVKAYSVCGFNFTSFSNVFIKHRS